MEPIAPISRAILKKELNENHFIRKTRKGENEIYSLNLQSAPNALKEIGRLREITFRASGGGTGKDLDLDHFDTDENHGNPGLNPPMGASPPNHIAIL